MDKFLQENDIKGSISNHCAKYTILVIVVVTVAKQISWAIQMGLRLSCLYFGGKLKNLYDTVVLW